MPQAFADPPPRSSTDLNRISYCISSPRYGEIEISSRAISASMPLPNRTPPMRETLWRSRCPWWGLELELGLGLGLGLPLP